MEYKERFLATLMVKNLCEKMADKNRLKPLKTAKEMLMLLNALVDNFDAFYTLGDNVNVYYSKDDKGKIKDVKIGA